MTWKEAHTKLVEALKDARDAGVSEDEALGTLDDVYWEDDAAYEETVFNA